MAKMLPGELLQGQRNDPAGLPEGIGPYQNGGLFSVYGTDDRVFSAMQMPQYGIIDALPVLNDTLSDRSEFGGVNSPLFTTFTGVTEGEADDFDNQPTEVCADGPEGGLLKVCTLTSQYGRFRFKVGTIDLETVGDTSTIGLSRPTLVNPIDAGGSFGAPGLGTSTGNIVRSLFWQKVFETSYSMARMFAKRIYIGNPTNTTSSNYVKDLTGLDIQVNAGNKRDALTSNLCTALDSYVNDFAYRYVTGSINPGNIVDYLEDMFTWLEWNATTTGLDPVEWVIVMRPELWGELIKSWPIRQFQMLIREAQALGASLDMPAQAAFDMLQRMRGGRVLPINGREVRVVLDQFIPLQSSGNGLGSGKYASDIYILPLRVRGGIPVTYLQPYNMANEIAEEIVREGRLRSTFTSDGGRFRWYVNERNGCVNWNVATRFRLLMHTPQLAGRITNVAFAPSGRMLRDSDPTSPYFLDGGRTNTAQVQFYTDWNGTTPVIW